MRRITDKRVEMENIVLAKIWLIFFFFLKFNIETVAMLRFRSLRHQISNRFRSDNETWLVFVYKVMFRIEVGKGENMRSKQTSNAGGENMSTIYAN